VIVAPEWWHDLHDPQLDRIMADALAGSPTLEDASARLRVVQALIANAKAALLPQVSGDVGSTYELLSNKYIYPAPLGGSGRWMSDAEVDIGWTLDLAGASTRWCAPHAPSRAPPRCRWKRRRWRCRAAWRRPMSIWRGPRRRNASRANSWPTARLR
jgi:hypothetical protein